MTYIELPIKTGRPALDNYINIKHNKIMFPAAFVKANNIVAGMAVSFLRDDKTERLALRFSHLFNSNAMSIRKTGSSTNALHVSIPINIREQYEIKNGFYPVRKTEDGFYESTCILTNKTATPTRELVRPSRTDAAALIAGTTAMKRKPGRPRMKFPETI